MTKFDSNCVGGFKIKIAPILGKNGRNNKSEFDEKVFGVRFGRHLEANGAFFC